MSVLTPNRRSSATRWALRASLFALQLLIAVALLHRFAGFPTPAFINTLIVVFALAALTVVLAIYGFVQIWRDGIEGTTRGIVAALIALGILAWPAVYVPTMLALPAINDITTDVIDPPRFVAVAQNRGPLANPAQYPGDSYARLQERAYPSLEPVRAVRPRTESFESTRDYITKQGWEILRADAPVGRGTGQIEAVDRSLILGFADDITVRIGGDQRISEVDIRSASRYGKHDFGSNATRVATLLKDLEVRLDTGIPLELSDGDARGLTLPEPNPTRRNGRPSPAALLAEQRRSRRAARGGRTATAGRPARSRLRYQDIFGQ